MFANIDIKIQIEENGTTKKRALYKLKFQITKTDSSTLMLEKFFGVLVDFRHSCHQTLLAQVFLENKHQYMLQV